MRRIDYATSVLERFIGGGRPPIKITIIALVIADRARKWPDLPGDWVSSQDLYDRLGYAAAWKSAMQKAAAAGMIRSVTHPADGRSRLYSLTPDGAARVREILEAGKEARHE